jgi:hypothetical protein
MLNPTASAPRIFNHDGLALFAAKEMRIGSSERELNVWHVKPAGPSFVSALMTTTPVT